MQIRPAKQTDALGISEIYNHYIENTIITFEEKCISPAECADRIVKTTAAKHPWLVYEENNTVHGYAYASSWQSRCAYRYSAETTIYLAHTETGKGIGTALYNQLIDELKQSELHSLIAGIAIPNESSIALHENLGFKKIAHFNEVGWKFDKWIDVGYWELLI